jgi:hypothetical protein
VVKPAVENRAINPAAVKPAVVNPATNRATVKPAVASLVEIRVARALRHEVREKVPPIHRPAAPVGNKVVVNRAVGNRVAVKLAVNKVAVSKVVVKLAVNKAAVSKVVVSKVVGSRVRHAVAVSKASSNPVCLAANASKTPTATSAVPKTASPRMNGSPLPMIKPKPPTCSVKPGKS